MPNIFITVDESMPELLLAADYDVQSWEPHKELLTNNLQSADLLEIKLDPYALIRQMWKIKQTGYEGFRLRYLDFCKVVTQGGEEPQELAHHLSKVLRVSAIGNVSDVAVLDLVHEPVRPYFFGSKPAHIMVTESAVV